MYEKESDNEGLPVVFFDYSWRVFALLHQELERTGYNSDTPHPIRSRFWRLVLPGVYHPHESRPLVLRYLESVEDELGTIIGEHSVAYWLHLYRRLAPKPIGADRQPATVGLVRASFEAAVQKYARFDPCDRVGATGEIPINMVLGGILMDSEFERERQALEKSSQLVLTNFGPVELREFYDVERLAYEVWRGSAMLRIIGKGAPIVVDDSDNCVVDARSAELDRLVRVFDDRLPTRYPLAVSATGLMFGEGASGQQGSGMVSLPTYNVGGVSTSDAEDFFTQLFHGGFLFPVEFNFLWFPFNLRAYRSSHTPFAEAFEAKYGVQLDAVLVVIAALCKRISYGWAQIGTVLLVRHWQRAYEGPYTREYVFGEIQGFARAAMQLLNVDTYKVTQSEVDRAIRFLELDHAKRPNIDLVYPGPHCVFLPCGDDRLFIDYAWIFRRLYDLFVGVKIPDQNFKGDALEKVVRHKKSILPVRPCRSVQGEQRQIDAAFQLGNRLVIVECKAVGHSIGFTRGDPQAIRYRNQNIDSALDEVDRKARWLAAHPLGTNYDLSRFGDILPVVVTPFVEYIPSLDSGYWLTEDLPRVLTPDEFKDALENGTLANASTNTVTIHEVSSGVI